MSLKDLHDWKYDEGGLSSAPADRPHWICKKCGTKDYSRTDSNSPPKEMKMMIPERIGLGLLSCNETVAARVMES